jgi:nickel-dependent lactate racemase
VKGLDRYANRSVAVVVPDATRPFDYARLGPLLDGLIGVEARPRIVVALGLHRPMTDGELRPLVAASRGVPVVQHDAATSATISEHVTSADAVICVGLVEPHQYAGFSGGIKTVSIGCASAAAIAQSHGLWSVADSRVAIGRVEDNPFQAMLWSRAAALEDVWALQVVPGDPAVEFFGPVRETFARAAALAGEVCFERWDAPKPWLRMTVPGAKAKSFYQASRAATYVALHPRPAVAAGGMLVVEAGCEEGIGRGAGEVAFARALRRGRDVLVEELRAQERVISGGEQRAYVLVRALELARIVVVGAPLMPELASVGVEQVDRFEALGLREAEGVNVEDVFRRVPCVRG